MSRKSTSAVSRTTRSLTADTPLDEVDSSEPRDIVQGPGSHAEHPEWPEANWQSSSYALLSGCQVKDYTDRIPDRVFDALFKD